MATTIYFGDHAQSQLRRFLPLEKDWAGRSIRPMIVEVEQRVMLMFGIDLQKDGVDEWGSIKRGGIFYKTYAYPSHICNPDQFGDTNVIFVLSGIKFQSTRLTEVFESVMLQNDRLADQVMALRAELAWQKQDSHSLRKEKFKLIRDAKEAKNMISSSASSEDEDETMQEGDSPDKK